jgi:hypothetical protein
MKNEKISFWQKIVLYWKFKVRYYPKQFIVGLKNLYKWTPIIWKDRDWDNSFLFDIIKFKISNMAGTHGKEMPYVGSERNVEIMNTIVRLIDKFQSEEYLHEYFSYVDDEYTFEKVEGTDYFEMKIENLRDDLDQYFAKYPLLKKRALNHKIYKENSSSVSLAMAMGFVQHERAKRLIFELLNRHIDKWWE